MRNIFFGGVVKRQASIVLITDYDRQLPARTLAAITGGFLVVASAFALLGPSLGGVLAEEDNHTYLRMLQAERGHNYNTKTRLAPSQFIAPLRAVWAAPARPAQPVRARAVMAYAPALKPIKFGPFTGYSSAAPVHALARMRPDRLIAPARMAPQGANHFTAPARGDGEATLSRRSVCVRLCDGFYYPVGDYNGAADNETHSAVCSGLCPGAPTRLYVVPGGSDKMDDAVSVRDNKPYRALPVAFRHTSQRDNTCSCRRAEESVVNSVSLLKDFTMRRGDRIMTENGFRIFKGAANLPYRVADFSALSSFSEISVSERNKLSAMERVSGIRSAQKSTPRPRAAETNPPMSPVSSRTVVDPAGKMVRLIGPQAMLLASPQASMP